MFVKERVVSSLHAISRHQNGWIKPELLQNTATKKSEKAKINFRTQSEKEKSARSENFSIGWVSNFTCNVFFFSLTHEATSNLSNVLMTDECFSRRLCEL